MHAVTSGMAVLDLRSTCAATGEIRALHDQLWQHAAKPAGPHDQVAPLRGRFAATRGSYTLS